MTCGTWYPFTVDHILDGDTVAGSVDLGGGCIYPTNIRLAGINAPELHGMTAAAGSTSKSGLRALLAGCAVRVQSECGQLDKYGRVVGYLEATPLVAAPVQLPLLNGGGPVICSGAEGPRDVSALMLAAGLAVAFMVARSGRDPLAA